MQNLEKTIANVQHTTQIVTEQNSKMKIASAALKSLCFVQRIQIKKPNRKNEYEGISPDLYEKISSLRMELEEAIITQYTLRNYLQKELNK
ncbi:MAG: hypothetical protein ACPG5B_06885 [Chitinophagales bacterium]